MNFKIKTFKELTTLELYEILKLRNEVFIVEQECPYQDIDDKDKKAYHLYLEKDNHIIAYLRILEKGVSYDQISLGRITVNKKHRGENIARTMLVKAITFVEEHLNETEIKIQAQSYLYNFYGGLGFTKVSEEYLEDNIPHIDMLYKK